MSHSNTAYCTVSGRNRLRSLWKPQIDKQRLLTETNDRTTEIMFTMLQLEKVHTFWVESNLEKVWTEILLNLSQRAKTWNFRAEKVKIARKGSWLKLMTEQLKSWCSDSLVWIWVGKFWWWWPRIFATRSSWRCGCLGIQLSYMKTPLMIKTTRLMSPQMRKL